MHMKKYILIIFLLTIYIASSKSQSDTIMYSKKFKFNDGIYITYNDFKNNKPSILFEKYINKSNTTKISIEDLFNKKKIHYYNENNNENEIYTKNIWGFCYKNKIYYQYRRYFYNIDIIGSIMLFYKSEQKPKQIVILSSDNKNAVSINASSRNIFQMIEFKTGDYYECSVENFKKILIADKELYDEYNLIKDEQEQKYKFYSFLIRFNEKHPIYFK